MDTYELYWSPEGKQIATVTARTMSAAIRKAPQPYRKYLGEIYAKQIGGRQPPPAVGSTARCAETGKEFVIAQDGCTFNYATSQTDEILSDEGVDIRERRELSDRYKPFGCYLSSDGKHVTGWKGNVLGTVTSENESRNGFGGSSITAIRVTDVHGGKWHGRGAGRGMCITLRPSKS